MDDVDLYQWIKSTPSYKLSTHMDDMLKFLQENYGISFFHYAKRLVDGSYFELTTDRVWGLRYVTEYMTTDTFPTLKHLSSNIWIWGEGVIDKREQQMHLERTEIYKIPQGISFILNGSDTFSYSSNKIDDKSRIGKIIEIRNKELIKFEKNFSESIEPIIQSFQRESIKKFFQSCKTIDEENLTQKEIAIVGFLAKGFRGGEISKLLNITEGTLKNKVEVIKKKLQCHTREQMIADVIKKGYF